MTGTLNGLGHAALELQRSTGDAAGQDFALLVEELLQEFGILVVDALRLKRQYFFLRVSTDMGVR